MKRLRGTEGESMDSASDRDCQVCRRAFLGRSVSGLGVLALNSLLNRQLIAAVTESGARGVVNPLHHAAKAKRVIFLYQAGGPSHLEPFDYKPKLAEKQKQAMPESFTKGQQIAQLQNKPLICFGPQYRFEKFGKSG